MSSYGCPANGGTLLTHLVSYLFQLNRLSPTVQWPNSSHIAVLTTKQLPNLQFTTMLLCCDYYSIDPLKKTMHMYL